MADWRADFEAYLVARQENPPQGLEALKTHMTELCRMFRETLALPPGSVVTAYRSDSMTLAFLFRDGKRYEVTIKEVLT